MHARVTTSLWVRVADFRLSRLVLPSGGEIFPSFGFAQPALACLRMEDCLLPAEEAERTVTRQSPVVASQFLYSFDGPHLGAAMAVAAEPITPMNVRFKVFSANMSSVLETNVADSDWQRKESATRPCYTGDLVLLSRTKA